MKIINAAKKAKKLLSGTGSENDIQTKDLDILDHIEKIVEISSRTGIDKCFSDKKGKKHFDYVAGKLGITPVQAVLFSHFLERSSNNQMLISDIADTLKCSTIRIIKYFSECDELEKKKLIRCSREQGCTTYRVPGEVRDSLRKFNELRPEKREDLDISEFFCFLERIFEERGNNELTFENLTIELKDFISLNMHLEFCKKITSYGLGDDDFALLVCFCHLFGNNNDDEIRFHDFEMLYDDRRMRAYINKQFCSGDHLLIDAKLIEFVNDNSYVDTNTWKLSDKAKKELLSELNIKGPRNCKKNLLLHSDIKPKKMFYNAREAKEIQTLISLLQEENYCKILERLDKKGMRNGFACLFSGGPGTGKTETAYQIARETKRNIMLVNIADIKSKWYGESEKKIKAIFDTYREAVKGSEIAPILLFNEADAVIGKRKEFSSGSRAVDQTDNTIQNIILEEMEKLSGILIATTNLTQNMDGAFERRFLFKITFDKPALESRTGIWNSLLPDLSNNSALELSQKYEFSGGQIENIARKAEIDSVLNGDALSMDALLQHCKDESQNGFSDKSKKIGF